MFITVNGKRYNRLIPVVASILIQMCLGTAYIWSVFQKGIATYLFNGDNASAALPFSLLLAILSIGSAVGGKVQDKIGPRPVILTGGVIVSIGFFLASLVKPALPQMIWLTYGILGGIGMGCMYSTTIACCQKWFPERKGLIGGIIVAALGFGGVVFTPVAKTLISSFGNGVVGVGELKTFALLALIFIVVISICGSFVVNPPEEFIRNSTVVGTNKSGAVVQQIAPSQLVKTPQYYILTITFMLACMAGLMMIAFAQPIAEAKGVDPKVAGVGVMVISIFNSIGRLAWGWVSDRFGRRQVLAFILMLTAIITLTINLFTGLFILILFGAIGFFYGGILGTFPAVTSDFFGTKNMGSNYGFVLIGFGIGAVASSYIAGHFKNIAIDDINLMFPAFIIAAIAAAIAAVLIFVIKPPKKVEKKA